MQCVAVWYSVLQSVAVRCRVLLKMKLGYEFVLQCDAV